MTVEITYTQARATLARLLDEVTQDREIVIIKRRDGEAVHAVLAAAGHQTQRREEIARLTERELEVLRLIAQGLTTRRIAQSLSISPKTADHHIQYIYAKIGVSTRAGATLFVMEHGLLN